jgi:FkbM family methyltransferase
MTAPPVGPLVLGRRPRWWDHTWGKAERGLAARLGRLGVHLPLTVRGGEADGLRISLRNASGDYATGRNELPVQRAVAAHLRPGHVFYDIGSNIGFFALIAARCVGPTGRVYAFEPVPANVACITGNARRNRFGNVAVLPAAVGAAAGTGTLLLSPHPGGATLSAADGQATPCGTVDVRVVAIDDLVAAGAIRPPDVIKLDVEGAESAVLHGARATLERHTPILIGELDAPSAEDLSRKQEELAAILTSCGYDLAPLAPSYADAEWHVSHFVATAPRPRLPS